MTKAREVLCIRIENASSGFHGCHWRQPFEWSDGETTKEVSAENRDGDESPHYETHVYIHLWNMAEEKHHDLILAAQVKAIEYAAEVKAVAETCTRKGLEAIELIKGNTPNLNRVISLLWECVELEEQYPGDPHYWRKAYDAAVELDKQENPTSLQELFNSLKKDYFPKKAKEIPSFGGFKPELNGVVSWDKEQFILEDDFGNLILDDRIDPLEGSKAEYADALEKVLFEDN